MDQNTENWKKVKLEIQYFSDETAANPQHTDSITFKNEGLESLKEIHSNPTKAIMMALQLALKLKRFDPNSKGVFKIESKEKKKGDLEIPEWK